MSTNNKNNCSKGTACKTATCKFNHPDDRVNLNNTLNITTTGNETKPFY